VSIAIMFAFYVLIDGVMAISAAWSVRKEGQRWGLLALIGALGIIAGAYAIIFPGIALVSLILLMGWWAMVTGVLAIIAAFRHHHEIESPVLLGLAGLVSVVFGIIVVARPIAGAAALILLLATYSIIFGVTMGIWAFQLRRQQHRLMPATGRRTEAPVT
jgi:uncharacterized membrane protein HdeD (DUF308 family)